MSAATTEIQHNARNSRQCNITRKGKSLQIGKEEIKPFLFADGLYGKSQGMCKTILELKSKLSKAMGYNINKIHCFYMLTMNTDAEIKKGNT